MPDLSYCAELIRKYQRNRYICTLFTPSEVREGWFALFAFAYEIESIAHKTSEEMIGFIRYAWWRDTLRQIFAQMPPKGHPVAEVLTRLIAKHHLPLTDFEKIIDTHEEAFAHKQPIDEHFFAGTFVPLFQLCAQAAGSQNEYAPIAIAVAAIEAAQMPATTPEHVLHYTRLAKGKLRECSSNLGVFKPFADMVGFKLKRLEKSRVPSPAEDAFWLPLHLWRKQYF